MKESEIQDRIRLELDKHGRFFRANAGQGWTGQVISNDGQRLLLLNPRPFHGLPAGFTDLFGVRQTVITPQMVGKTIGQACFVEVKRPGEKPKKHQEDFMTAMRAAGAIVGVAKSPEEAAEIMGGVR